jgi:hypothetical protein
VVVAGHEAAPAERHAVDVHELAGGARVLGGDDVGARQEVEDAQGDVARGADGRGGQGQAGQGRGAIPGGPGGLWRGVVVHPWTLPAPRL